MPSWLGTLIVLLLVGAMVALLVLSLIRTKKRGKGCCGCSQCKFNCPSRQEEPQNEEKKAE